MTCWARKQAFFKDTAGVIQGYGWRQSMLQVVNQLRIWSDPQPDFLLLGAHGLQVQQIDGGICLITRQYCDAHQAQVAVATHLDHIAIFPWGRGNRDRLVSAVLHFSEPYVEF